MEQIGRYRILDEIARGGMGTVYKAHDPADAMSVFNRAGARENLGDFEGAVADYELALRVDSSGRWSSQIRESLHRARQRLGSDR